MMWRPAISGFALAGAAAMSAGCASGVSGSSSLPPAGSYRASSHIKLNAKNAALLYVTEVFAGEVDVNLDSTWTKVGDIYGTQYPFSLCVDTAQNVYVVDDVNNRVTEYAHGGVVPIKTLSDHQGNSTGCAVNPTNGDLAIVNNQGPSYTPGNVIVYRGGKGTPTRYTVSGFEYYNGVAYDPSGDLFVDGSTGSASALGELPAGQKQFEALTLGQTVGNPQALAWDGTFLAIGDRSNNTIVRIKISGTKAIQKGMVGLYGVDELYEFCFETNKSGKATSVITADPGSGTVAEWDYPAGGTPIRSIHDSNGPTGVTLSE